MECSGLRRLEALDLCVRDVTLHPGGYITIFVARGKGGKSRTVPVIPGYEQDVLTCIEGRDDPDQPVFTRLPSHLDIHAIRCIYAQRLYRHLSGRELPPTEGRLRPQDYDRTAAGLVSQALGHGNTRVDTLVRHYLR